MAISGLYENYEKIVVSLKWKEGLSNRPLFFMTLFRHGLLQLLSIKKTVRRGEQF
jgi:hypothetical protein